MKTETTQEYLDRGGKITRIETINTLLPLSVAGPARKWSVEKEWDDHKDGQSPNLRWIGEQ